VYRRAVLESLSLSSGHLSAPGTGFAAPILDEQLEPGQIGANLPVIETQSLAYVFDQTGGLPAQRHGDPSVSVIEALKADYSRVGGAVGAVPGQALIRVLHHDGGVEFAGYPANI
jgi:hypothetical protein